MPLTKEQIKAAALELNPLEREELAEELMLSLDSARRDEIDRAWLAEARRRDAEFRAGRAGTKAVDEVLDRIAAKART